MYRVRWFLPLVVGLAAACGAPSTALAPSHPPAVEHVGLTIRSITHIATELLTPRELRGLSETPYSLVRSESGEQRVRQVLLGSEGAEVLRVESTLDGSLRLIAQSGVALESGSLSQSAAIARALRHLMRLGLALPAGGPAVSQVAGRTIVIWTREVHGVPVPDDGVRVVLNGVGALVGLAIEESPLATPPARLARSDAALRAVAALLPNGTVADARPELAWVLPTEGASEPLSQRVPRRLAWCVRGVLRDGAAFEVQLDAGNLALLGWDGAP